MPKEPDYYGVLVWRDGEVVHAKPVKGYCPGRNDELLTGPMRVSFSCGMQRQVVITFASPRVAGTAHGQQEVEWKVMLTDELDISSSTPQPYRYMVQRLENLKAGLAEGQQYSYTVVRNK